jgi:hypothetical protein
MIDHGINLGLALEIDAAEADAGVGRGGQEPHGDAITAVQPDSREAGRLPDGLLL